MIDSINRNHIDKEYITKRKKSFTIFIFSTYLLFAFFLLLKFNILNESISSIAIFLCLFIFNIISLIYAYKCKNFFNCVEVPNSYEIRAFSNIEIILYLLPLFISAFYIYMFAIAYIIAIAFLYHKIQWFHNP